MTTNFCREILLLISCILHCTIIASQSISGSEFFVDFDPGVGNATYIPATVGDTSINNFSFTTATLTPGFHNLYVRGIDTSGSWGFPQRQLFFIESAPVTANELVSEAEYFFDIDPGIGLGINLQFSADDTVSVPLSVNTSGLTSGFHTLYIRGKNLNGSWGFTHDQLVFVESGSGETEKDIFEAEYFFDVDPGIGLGSKISFSQSDSIDIHEVSTPLCLAAGSHFLYIRGKNKDGFWGFYDKINIIVEEISIEGTRYFCSGDSTTLSLPNGFSYQWSNGSASSSINVSVAGDYHVTMTDNFGCSISLSTYVVEENPIQFSILGSSSVCANQLAPLTVPSGFNYFWSTGDTSSTIHVPPGLYSVTITNNLGCSSSSFIIVDELPTPSLELEVFDDSGSLSNDGKVCAGEIASILCIGSGTINWNTGSISSLIFAEAPGYYVVTLTDNSGCINVDSVLITVTELPVVEYLGNLDGCDSVSLTMQGSFTFQWDGGLNSIGPNNKFYNSGIYSVTVSDVNGCTSTSILDVVVNNSPNILFSGDSIGCEKVILEVFGGSTYLWSGGQNDTSAINTFLDSGLYSVTATTIEGCTAIEDVEVKVFPSPVIEIIGNPINCDSVYLSATGGTDFSWNGGNYPSNATNLFYISGDYTVVTQNVYGCSDSLLIHVEVDKVEISFDVIEPVCFGGSTGGIFTMPMSGYEPFEWIWSNGLLTSNLTGMTAGEYSLMVSDSLGCTRGYDFILTQPDSILIDYSVTPASSAINSDGNATINISGGVAPYSILWSNGQVGETIDNVLPGMYSATVTDSNLCIEMVWITVGTTSGGVYLSTPEIKVNPNPTSDFILTIGIEESIGIFQIHDLSGIKLIEIHSDFDKPISLSHLLPGVYFWTWSGEKVNQMGKIIKL